MRSWAFHGGSNSPNASAVPRLRWERRLSCVVSRSAAPEVQCRGGNRRLLTVHLNMQNAGRTLNAMIRQHRRVSCCQRDGNNSHSAHAYGGCRMLAERCSANDATEHDPAALDDGGCTVWEDWQNVVAQPQNETQQSNEKARAQRQNAAVRVRREPEPPEGPAAVAELPFLDTASSPYPRGRRRSRGGVRVPHPCMRDQHGKEDRPRGRGVYPLADGHGASSATSLLPCIRPGLLRCLDHRTVRQNNRFGRRERVVCAVFHPPPS